jgi:superfamily II DNA or RNA helicase
MKISSQIAWEFDRQSISVGYRIYQAGGVEAELEPDGSVSSRVSGFRAILRVRSGSLEARCNCPDFRESEQCGHVWASLLYAEDQDWLSPQGRINLERKANAIALPESSRQLRGPYPKPVPPAPKRVWKSRADGLVRASSSISASRADWPPTRVILYNIQVQGSMGADVRLSVLYADPRKNGKGLTKARPFNLNYNEFHLIGNEADRTILRTLAGARESSYYMGATAISSWALYPDFAREILPRICATGRCVLEKYGNSEQPPLLWENEPWRFSLSVTEDNGKYLVNGIFTRGDQRKTVSDPVFIVGNSLLFTFTAVAPIECEVSTEWINNLRIQGPLLAPAEEWDELAATLMEARLPASMLPEELLAEEQTIEPVPCLRVESRKTYYRGEEDVGLLSFDYGGNVISLGDHRNAIVQPGKKLLVRDREIEQRAVKRLAEYKLSQSAYDSQLPGGWSIPPDKLGKIVFQLTKEGWRIDFKGKQVMQPTETVLDVSSGIDWFDLKATVSYGKHKYTYPQLLRALEMGGPAVILPDGEIGVLPDEWIAQVGRLASLGRKEGDGFRFAANQAGILDVLLADRPEARFDDTFVKARDRLKAFQGIRPPEQPPGFTGQLRDYQREGVGWMQFLRDFGFGGCLADDMGVGKTAQVLAMLETRRTLRAADGLAPSIAVVPRSLVFNWKQESERFTPNLRILDHTTPDRNLDQIADYDLVIVTYGTLRRDIVKLREIPFDYAILDEAQAIKNAASDSAKAARLLNARHRLALSGTPVQNSLSDLWSLFEFLNPGMLGASSAFKAAGGSTRNPEEQTRTLLARALRPLILRRTKEQVASELPPKVESILHCEMEDEQRKLYNELREHYRQSLLGAIDAGGMAKAKIMVLEALLRLRQAACHPGLIDKKRLDEPSAKLDTLLARLSEVAEEGHKALVFSQFTSFLDIVRKRLEKDAVRFEYLDGATKDRQARVENFEQDADCKLFLISLKAGGVGLNLVSADYVFLLDPWWNPAVEAQAIDRTHRIGQTRHVFAYRLIARDTVEEKVLALQESKRCLADAVINQDNSLLAEMGREELEYLLS